MLQWAREKASLHQLRRLDYFRRRMVAAGEWRRVFAPAAAFNPMPPDHRLQKLVDTPSSRDMHSGGMEIVAYFAGAIGELTAA